MGRPRISRSTIGRDPFAAVIPTGEPEDADMAGGDEEAAARPARRRGRPRTGRDRHAGIQDRPADGEQVGAGSRPAVRGTVPSRVGDEAGPVTPPARPGGPGRRKQKLTVHLDEDLVNRVKNAAYWNPRLNIARIAERGIQQAVEEVERENGGPYRQRESELVGGRPIR